MVAPAWSSPRASKGTCTSAAIAGAGVATDRLAGVAGCPEESRGHPRGAELLSGGYPEDEVEDGVCEVVAETFQHLETTGETIETVGRMQAIYAHGAFRRQ
jgi:hypothetical protein